MKMLNLKKQIEFKHNIENVIYDNFNNLCYSNENTIINYIIDDIIEIIENDDEIEIDDPEIIDISGMIKENLLNRFNLFNVMPVYENEKLINLVNISNFSYNYNIDKYNLIQYTTIMNFLNDHQQIIYDHDEKKFYELLNNNEIDVEKFDYYEIFYKIEIHDPENKKFKLYHYEYLFENYDVFITYEIINKFELINLFYKYADLIVENIVAEIYDDIKNYFKYA